MFQSRKSGEVQVSDQARKTASVLLPWYFFKFGFQIICFIELNGIVNFLKRNLFNKDMRRFRKRVRLLFQDILPQQKALLLRPSLCPKRKTFFNLQLIENFLPVYRLPFQGSPVFPSCCR